MTTSTQSSGQGQDGFFSVLGDVASSFLNTAAQGFNSGLQQAVPIWTKDLFGIQTTDQLAQPTYDPASAGGSVNPPPATTQPAVFDGNNLQVSSTGVLMMAAAAIGLILVYRS